jgi:pectate lyase
MHPALHSGPRFGLALTFALAACAESPSNDTSPDVTPRVDAARIAAQDARSGDGPGAPGPGDTGREPVPDAASRADGAAPSAPPDTGTSTGTDTGPAVTDDAAVPALADGARPDGPDPSPPSCDPFAALDSVRLCEATAQGCAIVFEGRQGCRAACALGGLACLEAMENLDGAVCGPDRARAALSCDVESGHGSDWCLCGPGAVSPPPDPPPDPPPGDCGDYPYSAASLLAERVGFGRNATGGDPARLYRVSSRDNAGAGTLRDALESAEPWWIVFDVEGEFVLDFDDPIQVRSDKTVDGRGRDVRLRNARFDLREGVHNVIFSDFESAFIDPQDNMGDMFSLRGPGGQSPDDYSTRDIWFHHLDLHHAGDGLIDVRGASNITLSWLHLHDHTKVMLHTSDMDENPSPGMYITYHHNFFDTVTRRGPHFAYGRADFFNNYQYHWYEYGIAAIDDAQLLSEANIYEAREGEFCIVPCPDPSPHGGGNDFFVSKVAVSNDWAQDQTSGYVKSVGDSLLNGAQVAVRQPERVFDRADHYVAVPEAATPELAERIRAGAGPRTQDCTR